MNNIYNDTCFIDTEDILYMTKYAIANDEDCETVIGNARCYSGKCDIKDIVELEYTYYDSYDKCICRTPFSYPHAGYSGYNITENTFSYYYDRPVNIFDRKMLKELGILIDKYIKTSLTIKTKNKIKYSWNRKNDIAYGFTMKDYRNTINYTYKSDIEMLNHVEKTIFRFEQDITRIVYDLLIKNNIDISKLIKPKEILFPPFGYEYNKNNYINTNIYKWSEGGNCKNCNKNNTKECNDSCHSYK